ncbi:hypothetical protein D3C86_1555800 [compost metagenome]
MHEDVAANVVEFRRHFSSVLGQRPGDVDLAVDRADGLWLNRVAHQPNGLARNAQADRDFRADLDEIEVISEGAAAQSRLLVPAVVAHLGTHQTGADGDFRFGEGQGHRNTSNQKPVQIFLSVQHGFIIDSKLYKSNYMYKFFLRSLVEAASTAPTASRTSSDPGRKESATCTARCAGSAPLATRSPAPFLHRLGTARSPESVFRDFAGGLLSISTAAICLG